MTPLRQKKCDAPGKESSPGRSQLVLSIFPGIDLLGKAFSENGFCVVTGPDLIYGGDIRSFTVPENYFDGVIGGSPCQGFSGLNRTGNDYNSIEMLGEYCRIVTQAKPRWFLLENVVRVPDISIKNYFSQRFNLDAGWYCDYFRLRTFQFGHLENKLLNPPISPLLKKNMLGGAALATDNRTFKEICQAQGLPDDFDLPSFNVAGKKRSVGNGVPLCLGRVVAKMIADVTRRPVNSVTELHQKIVTEPGAKKCACGCGRDIPGRKKTSSDACRKRLSRSHG